MSVLIERFLRVRDRDEELRKAMEELRESVLREEYGADHPEACPFFRVGDTVTVSRSGFTRTDDDGRMRNVRVCELVYDDDGAWACIAIEKLFLILGSDGKRYHPENLGAACGMCPLLGHEVKKEAEG